MPLIASVIIALFFFLGGCIQLGAYIARTPVQDVPLYIDALLSTARPLAVAAVLFMLIEIRLHGIRSDDSEYDAGTVPEKPIPRRTAQPSGDVSYFRINDTAVHASEQQIPYPSRAPSPQSPRTPFATPPPFEQKETPGTPDKASDAASASPPGKGDDSDLNFFKL